MRSGRVVLLITSFFRLRSAYTFLPIARLAMDVVYCESLLISLESKQSAILQKFPSALRDSVSSPPDERNIPHRLSFDSSVSGEMIYPGILYGVSLAPSLRSTQPAILLPLSSFCRNLAPLHFFSFVKPQESWILQSCGPPLLRLGR